MTFTFRGCGTSEGDFSMLEGHAPFMATLRNGPLTIYPTQGAAPETIEVEGGFAEVNEAGLTDLAEHVTPVGFAEGELTLEAESTTWATQVRLLLPQLHRTIDARVGVGVVKRIQIRGPQAPSWVAGPRRVKGRGPRDTYG